MNNFEENDIEELRNNYLQGLEKLKKSEITF